MRLGNQEPRIHRVRLGRNEGLWISNEEAEDNCLVFCESAIDALNYAALFPTSATRYASIGGQVNPLQPELVRAACARMPESSEIVAAMDADTEGRKLAEIVRKAVELSGRSDLHFRIHEPSGSKIGTTRSVESRLHLLLPTAPKKVPVLRSRDGCDGQGLHGADLIH